MLLQQDAFTHRPFYTDAFTHRCVYIQLFHTSPDNMKIAILPQFLTIQPRFVRNGCGGHLEIAILPQFLTIEPRFVGKGCGGHLEIAFLPQFFGDRTLANRNFTSVFGERTSFRAKGLRFVPSRWHCLAPAFRREIEKKERARGQEEKM